MPQYPIIDDLEVQLRTGSGIAVLLEGDSYEEDPWFYNEWFGDLAREITFFPQDGWPQVVRAVVELRRRCPDIPIYGIIDRDFADDSALNADFATQGILRTPLYTLENYLLDAVCWAAVFRFIFRRKPTIPGHWGEPEGVTACITDAYAACLPLAAHNWVIKWGNDRCAVQAAQTREQDRIYREHSDALRDIDPAEKLRTWGQQLGSPEDLGNMYRQRLAELEQADFATWQAHVSGKYVLHALHQTFPRANGQFALSHYLNLYMERCTQAPPDLTHIIDRIINHAHAQPAG